MNEHYKYEIIKKLFVFLKVSNSGYISGAPGMVDFIIDKLIDQGVEKRNIKTDLFVGY